MYDIGLSIWLCETSGETYWPPKDDMVSKYRERLQMPDPLTWRKYPIKVKRKKATYEEAKVYLQGLLNNGSNYETETKFGRGRRIRRKKKTESSDDEPAPKKMSTVKSSSKPIAAPPPILHSKPRGKISGNTESISKIAIRRNAVNVNKHTEVTSLSKKRLVSKLQEQRSVRSSSSSEHLNTKIDSTKLTPVRKKQDQPDLFPVKSSSSKTTVSSATKNSSWDSLKTKLAAAKTNENVTHHSSSSSKLLKSSDCNSPTSLDQLSEKSTSPQPTSHEDRDRDRDRASPPPSPTPSIPDSQGCSSPKSSSRDVLLTKLGEERHKSQITQQSSILASISASTSQLRDQNSTVEPLPHTKERQPQSPTSSISESEVWRPPKSHSSIDTLMSKLGSKTGTNRTEIFSDASIASSYESEEERNSVDLSSISKSCDNNSANQDNGSGLNDHEETILSHQTSNENVTNSSRPSSRNRTRDVETSLHRNIRSRTPDENWMERDILELKSEVGYLRGELQEANLNIARLIRFLMPHEKKLKLPSNMPIPKLHISSHDDFDRMEKFLEDKVNFDSIVEYLGLIPVGKKEYSAAMTLMAKVMSNQLASSFNFHGNGWKLAFKDTNMWSAVEGALSLHFEGSTLEEAMRGVRSWLRNAPGREGGQPKSFFLQQKKRK